MKTITIIFIGLIAHVNQPMSFDDTAVLPYAEGHTVQMVVPYKAIANPNNSWVVQQCTSIGEGDDKFCIFPLVGYAVKLEGTRRGMCDKDQIARTVPKLGSIAARCGGLRDEVRKRDVSGHFASFIDYGSGKLTVGSYFEEMLKFNENDPLACAPCQVRYDGFLEDTEAVFVFAQGGKTVGKLRIRGDNYVRVENMPIPGHEPPEDSHFLTYYKLLKNCDGAPGPIIDGTCTQPNICDLKRSDTGDQAPLADCTNSQYP